MIYRYTTAEWTSLDPILSFGCIGYDTDSHLAKVGNGINLYSALPYVASNGSGGVAWGAVTGTLSAQTDLQTSLDGKSGTSHNHDSAYEAKNANIQSHISSTSNPHSVTKSQVGLANVDNVADISKPISSAQQTALDLKVNLASPTFTGTVSGVTKSMVGLSNVDNTLDSAKPVSTAQQTALDLKANLASPTFTGTVGGITKSMVGLGSVDNTADTAKPVSTAQQTALNLKADLASPTLTGTPLAPTAGTGTNTTQIASTAYVQAAVPNASYRTILEASGSHTAAKVAGTYALGQGDPIAVSGTGTLYPINTIFIAVADYPTVDGKTPKLRIRAQIYTNDVAPTGNFTIGLYPITRPGTSGGAGLCIYTLGTVISGSNGATFTTPAADGLLNAVGSDFALPADGHYVLGVVTTGTIATSAHVHLCASLQIRNA